MEVSMVAVPSAANTQAVAVSGTSAQSAVIRAPHVIVQVTEPCFVIRGANPTATSSCLPLLVGQQYRLTGFKTGERLAFITAGGTGTAYVTPEA